VMLSIQGLPGARFAEVENAIVVSPEESKQIILDIVAPPGSGIGPGVNQFKIVSQAGNDKTEYDETFIMPFKNSP